MFDIHCHILNGVDDGSRTPAESHQMLLAARDAGIDHIVCTPHCKHSDFDAELIEKRYRAFKAHAEKNGVRLSLELPAPGALSGTLTSDWVNPILGGNKS